MRLLGCTAFPGRHLNGSWATCGLHVAYETCPEETVLTPYAMHLQLLAHLPVEVILFGQMYCRFLDGFNYENFLSSLL